MKINWLGSKHAWDRGTTTVVTTRMSGGSTGGRHRAGKGLPRCKFCPKDAKHLSSNNIPVCGAHAHMLR
jgi:hypothetical protein